MNFITGRLIFWAVIFLAIAVPLIAQAQDASLRYPEPSQVNADYPDDAQRFAAFNILYDSFSHTAPKPLSEADYAKSFSYQASSNMVAAQKMTKDGAGSQAYRDFNTRSDQLISDSTFTNSVLAKYHLGTMAAPEAPPPVIVTTQAPVTPPVPASPTPAPVPIASNPAPTQNHAPATWLDHWGPIIIGVLYMFPGVLFTLLLIVFLTTCSYVAALAAWLVLRRSSGAGRKVYPVPAPLANGLPALPQNLQVVSLPCVRYAVYVLSGMVLENNSTTHTQSYAMTTNTGTGRTTDGQLVTGIPETTRYSSSTVENAIWIRQPNGIDVRVSIFDGNFQCRAGHLISVLARQGADGGYIILAYNHSMGALTQCPALDQSHEARGNELGQWAANIAGAIAAAIFMSFFFNFVDETGWVAGTLVYWLVASFLLVCISFFIGTPLVKSRILKCRNARFRANYLPGYRQFFEQGTPVLQRIYQTR